MLLFQHPVCGGMQGIVTPVWNLIGNSYVRHFRIPDRAGGQRAEWMKSMFGWPVGCSRAGIPSVPKEAIAKDEAAAVSYLREGDESGF